MEEVWKQGVVKQKISAASFQPIPSPAITPSVSEHPGAIWSFQLPATIQTVRLRHELRELRVDGKKAHARDHPRVRFDACRYAAAVRSVRVVFIAGLNDDRIYSHSVREPVARFCVFILVGRQWSKANR